MKHIKGLLLIGPLLSLLVGCAGLTERRAVGEENTPAAMETVPKVQYDQLLAKYETLLKKANEQQDESLAKDFANKKLSDVADEPVELVETVDLFEKNANVAPKEMQRPSAPPPPAGFDENGQVIQLKKASLLVQQNKFDEAMEILKELENSPSRQVKVRAKYLIGDLLFAQGSYDLAMQMFEEILKNYAFSGVVLKTFPRLIACAKELKLDQKLQQYTSIFYDVFSSM